MPHPLSIHTGNILHVPDLKRKPGHTPADELLDCLKLQLSNQNLAEGKEKICPAAELSAFLNPDERSTQKITVKLFISTPTPSFITSGLNAALEEIGAKSAELFILSWPAGLTPETGKPLWEAMESLFDQQLVSSLGISDIETQAFVDLHNGARIKPEAIQINLESCCVVPPELVTFTRENNIQLLTHNDPVNILPTETLKTILPNLSTVHWTVRYLTLLRCRGIIHNKGYIVSAECD